MFLLLHVSHKYKCFGLEYLKLQSLPNHWAYSVSNEVDMFMLTLDDLAPSWCTVNKFNCTPNRCIHWVIWLFLIIQKATKL